MDLSRAVLLRALRYWKPYSRGMCTSRLSQLNTLRDAIYTQSFPNATLRCTVDRSRADRKDQPISDIVTFAGLWDELATWEKSRGLLCDRQ